MNKIKNTIETLQYGYDPNKFFPIFEDTKLQNKNEFVLYKLRSLIVDRSLG